MARTTIDIDDLILKEIKAIQKREGRSMGKIVSQLLSKALVEQKTSAKRLISLNLSQSQRQFSGSHSSLDNVLLVIIQKGA